MGVEKVVRQTLSEGRRRGIGRHESLCRCAEPREGKKLV